MAHLLSRAACPKPIGQGVFRPETLDALLLLLFSLIPQGHTLFYLPTFYLDCPKLNPWLPPSAATVFKTLGTGVSVPWVSPALQVRRLGRSGSFGRRAAPLSSHAASPSSFPR